MSADKVIERCPKLKTPHPLAAPLDERKGAAMAITDLRHGQCKWPAGNALDDTFYFCCAVVPGDGPYCPFHSWRAIHNVAT